MGVRRLVALAMVFAFAVGSGAHARLIQGGPDPMSDFRSVERVLKEADGRPVQLIFVHGMRATGTGTSDVLRRKLAERLSLSCGGESPKLLEAGDWPEHAVINGRRIWPEEPDWSASRPFLLRHVCKGGAGTLIVDEVNWWPLLFPIKCPFLIGPESQLSGSHEQLERCGRWIDVETLKSSQPQSLGGSVINKVAKQELFNWGFADAVIAIGPMRDRFRTTMVSAFETADRGDFVETIIVSESLGSFVVLDALISGQPAVQRTLDRTGNFYFFANQFALLSLARIENLDGAKGLGSEPSPLRALDDLSQTRKARGGRSFQIVAFNDPSDLLTWCVPDLDGADVANVFVRNQWTFLGLLANPVSAHTGHSDNGEVLKVVIEGTDDRGSGRDPRCYAEGN